MERPYTGLTAQIKLNQNLIGYMNGLELNLSKDVIEILQFGAQYKEKVPAIKNWTASAEGTVAFSAGESQEKLYQAFESGELVELTIMLDEQTNFTGKALVTSLSISGAPDDSLNISAEFEGSGSTVLTLPQTYFVNVSSGNGGTTDPAGDIRVIAGKDFKIAVIASVGYKPDKYTENDGAAKTISSTLQDGVYKGEISLMSIKEDKTIRVTFVKAETT